jgi:hypothetical protein
MASLFSRFNASPGLTAGRGLKLPAKRLQLATVENIDVA